MIAAVHAERLEAALGHLDAASRKLPACPAGPVLAVIEHLDRARAELGTLLGRPAPAPPDDDFSDALPDDEDE